MFANSINGEINLMKTVFTSAKLKKIIDTETSVKKMTDDMFILNSQLSNCVKMNDLEELYDRQNKMVN